MNKKKTGILIVGFILILSIIILLITFFGKEKKETTLVGLIITGSIDESGWNRYHYMGLKEASEGLNVDMVIKQNVSENTGECRQAVTDLINEGVKLIILGSFNYQHEVADIIEQHQEINFYSCSDGVQGSNISTYFVRAYQARYLSGIVAGQQTKNNRIGYVAAMSNNEVNRGINAFTLGVQSVNPDAQVYVVWTGSWDDEQEEREATRTLIEKAGVDLIAYHQNQTYVVDEAEKASVYSIGYNEYVEGYSNKYLTAVKVSWKNAYGEILKEYMQGKGNRNDLIWIGIEKEAVGLTPFTDLVSEETKRLVEEATVRMRNGWELFSGTIVAQDDTVKCQTGEVISDDILFNKMDWFVKGVIQYEN